jgi:serine/threonine protein kinase
VKAPTNLRGYTLERPLGKGGMGAVWVARKLSTHQTFAIKFLKEEFLDDVTYLARFEREVAALRAIRHPNVVNVFEWSMPKDDHEAKPYVVMELLEGEGLDRLLRRQRILQPQLAVAILLQVLDGLAAAHNVGVIHRDLGPSNVFLTPQANGTLLARVLDFGLARPVSGEEEAQVTQMGTLMGKPGYVAPETFVQQSVDGRVDIFACGMMMYRMLAGRLPFRETQAQMLWSERYAEKSHTREYTPIRELAEWVPEKLSMIVAKAILRNPEQRYHTAEDMQVDLLDIEDSVLARAGAKTPPPPTSSETTVTVSPGTGTIDSKSQERNSRKRWVMVGGAAAAVALVGVILLVWGLGGGSTTAASKPDEGASVAATDAGTVGEEAGGDPSAPDVVEVAVPEAVAVVPADAAKPAEEAAVVVEARTVLVVVAGAPAGATIKVGEIVPEGEPPKVRLPWSEDLVTVTVEATGYEKFTEAFLPTADHVVNVQLRAIRRPPPRRDAGRGRNPEFPEFPEGP